MQILTPTGYRDISACSVGDEVCAFDATTGAPIINHIEAIEPVDLTEWQRWWQVEPSVPSFDFYLINGTFTLFREQSVWTNGKVVHARDLVVGDTIYSDADADITITSIATVSGSLFYRLEIDGDHSYVADGLTLHNASRFWVGGTGTWDSSATTHWASTTGGSSGASAPGSADTVTLDGSSGGGTVTPSYGGTGTFQSITCGAFTGTIDWSINNNSVTLSAAGNAFSGSGSGTRTINLGNGTFTLTSSSATWTMAITTGLTFNANSSTISFTGTSTGGRTFNGGGLNYATVSFGSTSGGGNQLISTSANIGTLNITAPCYVIFPNNVTTTITNAFAWTGSSGSEIGIVASSFGTQATISCANASTIAWASIREIAFAGGGNVTATNSFDLGHNSISGGGALSITAPASGGSSLAQAPIIIARGTPY